MKDLLKGLFLIAAILFGNPDAWAACPDPMPEDTLCLEWEAPTQNVDGTPLTDLAGFEVYWDLAPVTTTSEKIDIPDPLSTQLEEPLGTINIPSPGPGGGDVPVYFRMTAYDDDGNVSQFSNEVLKTVTFPDNQGPGAPILRNVFINLTTS